MNSRVKSIEPAASAFAFIIPVVKNIDTLMGILETISRTCDPNETEVVIYLDENDDKTFEKIIDYDLNIMCRYGSYDQEDRMPKCKVAAVLTDVPKE